ncbi:MAG: pyridoxal phosphate-dependent aminotransferase [Clostridia bacterium]|nr:pyridoxal phosphate-dependent aminotransferase [Clostridia bacterium]
MNLSDRMSKISASPTLAIDAKFKKMKADGIDVVGFGTGEPDFDTPDHIKDAAIKAINDGMTKYTPAAGTLDLRKAIADKLLKENNVKYAPTDIVVSNGAKHALVNAFYAILNEGDEVLIPTPFWVSYPEMVRIAGGTPVFLETTEQTGFKFSAKDFENAITPKTKALVLNSPSNPTGMVYNEQELREIADVAVKHNIFVISDEIYEKLMYGDAKHVSIASFNDEIKKLTIIINGVSKSYAMTGWRIGYTACEPEIAKIISNVQSHASSNPCSISQAAALAAITGPTDTIEAMRVEFEKRRNYMVERINSIDKVSALVPDGAFYVFMNIKELMGTEIKGKMINNGDEFCEWLLERNKLALVPGGGFGAEGYVRWSYATSMENIKEGLDRLEDFLA